MYVYIYHLLDDRDRVCYVGKSRNPYARLLHHIGAANSGSSDGRVTIWLRDLLAVGFFPAVRVVQWCADSGLAAEASEIHKQLALGSPIMNVSTPTPCTPAVRSATKVRPVRTKSTAQIIYEMRLDQKGRVDISRDAHATYGRTVDLEAMEETRLRLGKTPREVSQEAELGIDEEYSNIINGFSLFPVEYLGRIAKVLGVKARDLLK